MKTEQKISLDLQQAITQLYNSSVAENLTMPQKTKKTFEGNLTIVVFPFLKISKKKPDETAKDIAEWFLTNTSYIEKYNIAGGFLNLTIKQEEWIEQLNSITLSDNYGQRIVEESEKRTVMVEYSSPNTNKPLHLGHIRNNLLGWSLAQIMKANGNKVIKTNIVNDRGIHICKSMIAWQKWFDGKTPDTANKKGDHLVGDCYVAFDKHYKEEVKALEAEFISKGLIKEEAETRAKQEAPLMKETQKMLIDWEKGDEKVRDLWKTMNQWVYKGFDETYKLLGVDFDKIYYESDTYLVGKAKVEDGLHKGVFFKKEDGSVWADLTNDGLDQKLLIRADGTSVYMTQDLGTATLRYDDFNIDEMIYVVGNEQNYHFQVLSLLLDKLGIAWGKDLVHFSYGMVELPTGKMKSREGTVVDADDLVNSMINRAKEVGDELGKFNEMTEEEKLNTARIVALGALKYFMLKVDPRKNMLFNPEESIDFNGNTGPFIQYTHARIKSVLRKAETQNIDISSSIETQTRISEKEIDLIQKLCEYPSIVQLAAKDFSPSTIANYCYELTKEFNQFYHDFTILKEEDENVKKMRLSIAACTAKVLKNGMSLLGIEVPEKM